MNSQGEDNSRNFSFQSMRPLHPILAIVVPCYNEALLLEESAEKLSVKLQEMINNDRISAASFVFFVDDGSTDETWRVIFNLHQRNPARFKGLKLTRNVGSQTALLAGLLSVREKVDCALSIDADLQQDAQAIPDFLEKYEQGAEIVYGVRIDRKTDPLLKRATAAFFYKLMKFLGTDIIENHADYRLVSRKALDALATYGEYNLFLRGIFPNMGFKADKVYYQTHKRSRGESKFSFLKMCSLALSGITSFSILPLRLAAVIGTMVFLFSCAMIVFAIFSFIRGKAVPGWASIVIAIYFIGGIQLIFLGLIGEYLGRIYQEVKSRPRFIEEEKLF